jgi:hypothetical protein
MEFVEKVEKDVIEREKMYKLTEEASSFKFEVKERGCMATRQSIEEFLERCVEVLEFAKEQYIEGSKQEHYYDEQFQQALQQLEEAYNDLMHLTQSANAQQKEQLHRMRLQLQQLQNDLILLDHDR